MNISTNSNARNPPKSNGNPEKSKLNHPPPLPTCPSHPLSPTKSMSLCSSDSEVEAILEVVREAPAVRVPLGELPLPSPRPSVIVSQSLDSSDASLSVSEASVGMDPKISSASEILKQMAGEENHRAQQAAGARL